MLTAQNSNAGGDIKRLREDVLKAPYQGVPPPGHEAHQVFQAEYRLMCQVARYPKPCVSLCEGIWMGFGVGMAVFGSRRVVTETTKFAMPENSIGNRSRRMH